MSLKQLEKDLKKHENKKQAEILQRFFKTGKGEYGEGDIFLGLTMGENRLLSKKFKEMSINDIQSLLKTNIHEKRMIALLILIENYNKAKKEDDENKKKEIFDFYLDNTKNINNWDLVDLSAPNIVGDFLLNKDRKILYKLVVSENLWERRIAILSTFTFIRNNEFDDCSKISEILLKDKNDLTHKAVGWMLRELGKKDQQVLEDFLKKHYKEMPRTMLRYSIERFEENKRKAYLNGKI